MWNCRTSRGSDPCEQKNKCWWCGYGSNTYSNSPVHLQVRGIPIHLWLHMLVKSLPRMCRFGNGSGARVVFVAATFSFLDFLSRWNRMVDVPAVFFCWVHNFFCFWHVRKDILLVFCHIGCCPHVFALLQDAALHRCMFIYIDVWYYFVHDVFMSHIHFVHFHHYQVLVDPD